MEGGGGGCVGGGELASREMVEDWIVRNRSVIKMGKWRRIGVSEVVK